jgi:methyltransferase (TIGR00027 family)
MRRALHQEVDRPVLFADPLAMRVIGEEAAREVLARKDGEETVAGRNLRVFMAVRSRLAEDELADAVGRGVTQYVVLGAGLDTFGYRNPFGGSGLKVFEVDHPATQAWKRARLVEAGIGVPDSVRFVPVDFERRKLREQLPAAGFDEARSVFFSWLGVVPYLTREAFVETTAYAGAIGGEVVFDYAVDPKLLSELERAGLESLSRRVAKVGEPFRLFFEPGELAELLKSVGFGWTKDWDTMELNARYFQGRRDGLKLVGRVARIIHAWAREAAE